MFIGAVASNAGDVLVTILPIPIVLQIKMPLQQRMGVMILFSLGFFAIIAGSVRTFYIWDMYFHSYDVSWLCTPLYISSSVEMSLGLVCSCEI
jgi:hypothetical protein